MTRVLVTGGARGIGAAIVEAAAAAGHDVVFTYRSSSAEAEALLARLRAEHPGRSFEARPLDLADRAAVESFAAALADEEAYFGFVHNAGLAYDMLAAILDPAKVDEVMQVNFVAATRLSGALVRPMSRARAGRIVFIGSVAGLRANPGNAAYGASKAALASYARSLAVESGRRGVTVNIVSPGFVDTDMIARYADHRPKMESQIPLGRFARPEEVAGLAVFLLSPAAAYITGATIPIDGGMMAQLGLHR